MFLPFLPIGRDQFSASEAGTEAPKPRKLAGVPTARSTMAHEREASTEDTVTGAQQPAGGWGGGRCRISGERETGEARMEKSNSNWRKPGEGSPPGVVKQNREHTRSQAHTLRFGFNRDKRA